ncbi:hypothetical protein E2C01_101059 [Portunus trituberculatus]|uniref:Uncharacterized protein n=1 Tax=Portunus trituberculatus TaxID=210409 RepID=A0A5B7K4Q3_PORTR|nr:hypothetical protein [Portunus trituberculatus]
MISRTACTSSLTPTTARSVSWMLRATICLWAETHHRQHHHTTTAAFPDPRHQTTPHRTHTHHTHTHIHTHTKRGHDGDHVASGVRRSRK